MDNAPVPIIKSTLEFFLDKNEDAKAEAAAVLVWAAVTAHNESVESGAGTTRVVSR